MAVKPSLTFYTNIPTPYQLSFFDALSGRFDLTVVYYANTENGREWNFNLDTDYKVVVLKDNFIARKIQKKVLDFHFTWRIFSAVWSQKSDYVIVGGSYWIPDAVVAFFLNRFRTKKIAYFSEPLFVVSSKIKYAVKWSMLRILRINADAIFCVGKKAADSFESYGIKCPKYVIPYNINSKEFINVDKTKVAEYRQRYKNNGEVVILSSGSLIERKGMDILINAVKQIEATNIKLIIMGDGPLRNELEALANGDERIVFAGFQTSETIPYFFAIADIFAFASRYDGWAVVINEAIAANVPVISSDKVGAAIDLITSPELGIICKSGDVDAFRDALQLLIKDENKRQLIRDESKKLIPLISSDYNADYVYDIFLNKL